MSVETSTRGKCLSWLTVAERIILSESNDLEIPELSEEEEEHLDRKYSIKRLASKEVRRAHDDTGWPITRNKLERFVEGEKSRSTGDREYSTPEVWVRCVIHDFLVAEGFLPSYFDDHKLEAFFPAFALADHFSVGRQGNSTSLEFDFDGTYQRKDMIEGEYRLRRLRIHALPHVQFFEVEEASYTHGGSKPKDVKSSGWAIIPPFDGLLIFLTDKNAQTITQRLYIAHSMTYRSKNLVELVLLPYQGIIGKVAKLAKSKKKSPAESSLFINDILDSFDKVPRSVKPLKRRSLRGEPAYKLDEYEPEDIGKQNMSDKNIDAEFLFAVCEGDLATVEALIDLVKNINSRLDGSGGTALHVVADNQFKDIFKILRKRSDLYYLVKDNAGQLPSQLAMNSEEDIGLGTYLKKKEMQQAHQEGIDYRAFVIGDDKHSTHSPTPSI